MAPTLAPGDRVAVETQPGLIPKRGEVWLFDLRPNMTLAKRVVGMPGETIEVARGCVLINGEPLAEPYLTAPISYTMAPVALGFDEYFMLGDNRDASNDSHVWGPLPYARFVGRAEYRCWPTRRVGGLR
jgi:signal peptidase I